MTNSQRLAAVRRCLDRWLEEQHAGGDIEIGDAVLIRDGFYVGRRFQLGKFQAVWFMEEDEVKIHDATGALLVRLDSAAIDLVGCNASSSVIHEVSADRLAESVSTIPMLRAKPASDQVNRRAA